MPDNKKILIIDDEADLGLLLKDYFARKKNYDVMLTQTLGEGKDLLGTYNPNILFLDNNLPDDEGWKYAPQLAKQYPDMYIVLISAYHPHVPVMPTGAHFRVIEKPIKRSDLDEQFAEL
jgi:two-component system response regulator HydG